MKTIYLKDNLNAQQSVNVISVRIEFKQDFENDFDLEFVGKLDTKLKELNLYVPWGIGRNFVAGYFEEFGEAIPFRDAEKAVLECCSGFEAMIASVTFDRKPFLLATHVFWTFVDKEMAELEPLFRKQFPDIGFIPGYGDAREWFHGTSPNDEQHLHVSRKHHWKQGDAVAELIIAIGSEPMDEAAIDTMGNSLAQLLDQTVYVGNRTYVSEDTWRYEEVKRFEC